VPGNRLGRILGIVGEEEQGFFIGNGLDPFDGAGLQVGEAGGIEALGDNLPIGAIDLPKPMGLWGLGCRPGTDQEPGLGTGKRYAVSEPP